MWGGGNYHIKVWGGGSSYLLGGIGHRPGSLSLLGVDGMDVLEPTIFSFDHFLSQQLHIIWCYMVVIFYLQNPDLHGWEIQKNSTQVIMGVVNLMLTPTLPSEIRHEAAEVSNKACFYYVLVKTLQ